MLHQIQFIYKKLGETMISNGVQALQKLNFFKRLSWFFCKCELSRQKIRIHNIFNLVYMDENKALPITFIRRYCENI